MSSVLYHKFKNFFDKLFAFFFLIILSPVFLIVSVLIILFLGKPIIFRQVRPGHNNKLFTIYKFRTMSKIQNNTISPHDQSRISLLGKILRKSSLDEIPQLINIINGDMSFVGPRPLLIEYLDLYSKEQLKRHNVKPGLSGWAQINGRNALLWPEKFKLDVWYVDNQSFLLDMKIIILTFLKIFQSSGINSSKDLTSKPFQGNEDAK